MSTASPHPISPRPEHSFVYVDSTVPPGMTLDQWRRTPRERGRHHRRGRVARIARVVV